MRAAREQHAPNDLGLGGRHSEYRRGPGPEDFVLLGVGLFRPKLARVLLGAEDLSANSGLGTGAEDVMKQSAAEGEFSRIANEVET